MMALRRIWPKVVLFGDSHSQRSFDPKCGYWGALLADKLQRIADVVPRGFSGYNTRYCKLIMKQVFESIPSPEVACVTVLLGSNDSSDPASPTGQHVPLDTFSQNLVDIIGYISSIGIPKERIILMSPPNYFHEVFIKACLEQGRTLHVKSDEKVREYADACRRVASEQAVTFLDVNGIFSGQSNSSDLFADGLHFSSKGAQLLHDHLCPIVVEKLESFTGQPFEKLTKFPIWSEVDSANPEKSFESWK